MEAPFTNSRGRARAYGKLLPELFMSSVVRQCHPLSAVLVKLGIDALLKASLSAFETSGTEIILRRLDTGTEYKDNIPLLISDPSKVWVCNARYCQQAMSLRKGICWETKEVFLYELPDRTAVTLMDTIQACMAPDSNTISDVWTSYQGIETTIDVNYTHETMPSISDKMTAYELPDRPNLAIRKRKAQHTSAHIFADINEFHHNMTAVAGRLSAGFLESTNDSSGGFLAPVEDMFVDLLAYLLVRKRVEAQRGVKMNAPRYHLPVVQLAPDIATHFLGGIR
ncbi:hypothetical protein T265_08236 [Opisthorchis viverrini]|uniref:ISXO2-like transposase domain-containing protein n=1 Tax=Opisthorchis viverrini TaxID=6198 RepID=A0A074Z9S9_OPIVI|nr:hypothetical protein T265_08236 [Opisthorchis viverrini]KER23991.1 hypothetical protein T265_08236 [Opisthorchis viverrini]